MKYFVSACLLGENCKWNGGNNYDSCLSSLLFDQEVSLICPEVEGGLSTPRCPIEIKDGRALDKNGNDYTSCFLNGAERILAKAKSEKPDAFILQPRSPTCGLGNIYDGTFSGKLIKGNGFLCQILIENGYKVYTPDDFKSLNI